MIYELDFYITKSVYITVLQGMRTLGNVFCWTLRGSLVKYFSKFVLSEHSAHKSIDASSFHSDTLLLNPRLTTRPGRRLGYQMSLAFPHNYLICRH